MSLIEKVTKKYAKPEIEIVQLDKTDIITSSGEIPMAKLSPEELVEESNKKRAEENERKFVELGTGNVTNIYPDGVPLEVLKLIDFKHFGAMLKQEQLLPPSYNRKPSEVTIDVIASPVVELIFKSTTSDSYRTVGISRYYVSCGKNGETVNKIDPLMIAVWRRFAERVMWAWERGYNYALVGPEKNIETYRKPRLDEATMQNLQIAENNKADFVEKANTNETDEHSNHMKRIQKWNRDEEDNSINFY